MAKLTRVTGKVFGATASTTNTPKEIGQFGSAKAGTYNATGDVATIQNLSAWSNGWIDAVTPTQQFPSLPEMTGVHKVLSYQSAYILQQGIPEWDNSTNYYINGFCSYSGTIYKSLTNDNLNHNPSSSPTHWTVYGAITDYANQSLSNLNATGEAHFINKSQVTNCITSVPITYDLQFSGGSLTLKAGSVVTVPNGTNTFTNVTITSDLVANTAFEGLYCVRLDSSLSPLALTGIQNSTSGTTQPAAPANYDGWYDTTNNIIKRYVGGWQDGYFSLPICYVNSSGTAITAVRTRFDGFGFFGNLVFSRNGITGLIPSGINQNGLVNTAFTTSGVHTTLVTGQVSVKRAFSMTASGGIDPHKQFVSSNIAPNENALWYLPSSNIIHILSGGTATQAQRIYAFDATFDANGNVSQIFPRTTLHLPNYDEFPRIVDYYFNAGSGYTIWSNGRCEQYGFISFSGGTASVTLLKDFSANNYVVVFGDVGSTYGANITVTAGTKTVSGFSVAVSWPTTGSLAGSWYYAIGEV